MLGLEPVSPTTVSAHHLFPFILILMLLCETCVTNHNMVLKMCLVAKAGVLFLFGYSAAMNLALLILSLNLHSYVLVA